MLENLYAQNLFIGPDEISIDSPTYFIADIAANHDGDLERAKDLIWKAKEAGANAAKFQHFEASTIVSDKGFKQLNINSHQSKWDKSVFEVYKNASVSLDWTPELKSTCEKAGITFFTSPYAFDLVDAIDPFVPAYKIGSGDITWINLIKHIASKGKPYILATGASTLEDVIRAVSAGLEKNNKIALLQCNTNYTGSIENMRYVQLNVIKTYAKLFPGMVLGLSDHTPGFTTVLGAISLGARIVEKHFTDDITRLGPDHAFSMDPVSWSDMILRSRELEASLGNGVKNIESNEYETVILQRRAVRFNKNFSLGHIVCEDDLEMLRPCPKNALSPHQASLLLGVELKRDVEKGDHALITDIDNQCII